MEVASIRKRSGRYQVRVVRQGFPALSKTFINKADGERWARSIERNMDAGNYQPTHATPKKGDVTTTQDMTVRCLLQRYLTEVSPLKRGGNMEIIRLTAMCARPIADQLVAKVSPATVAAYRDLRLLTVSGTTVCRDLDDLSAVFGHASREWGVDIRNPVTGVRRPEKSKGRSRVLSPDEELNLLNALSGATRDERGRLMSVTRNSWIQPLVELALATAMRRGELLALQWCNIDLERRVAILPLTKNGDRRAVPLSSTAVRVLAGLPRQDDGDLVFPITAMALRKAFERACDRAGLSDLHFHDLRHTATTRMAERLPNVIELAAVTGHKDVRMLQRYYHPRAEDLAVKLG